ncbi:shikimate kinase [Microbacterium stercoris]|uniref:Shikimate kinase n=1 Tax=Microbacterium stercoris TaxID=2820289 RepID=A0A939QJV9_9MICO|nr:shikimate kinase [Microbacterium stercoris]MBO3664263.1 shikimate kinase [Microbacterium stercoris]
MTSPTDAEGPRALRAVVLVGPMGAGKSSIGRRLAKTLGVTFRDTDSLIVREHGPITEIFAEHGEPHFRDLEHRAVLEAIAHGGVVALGGGAPLHPGTRDALRAHHVALLTVDAEVVAARIRNQKRPLLNTDDDPVDAWIRIRDARDPIYRDVADATFDTSHGPLSDVVKAIAEWVRTEDPDYAAASAAPAEQTGAEDTDDDPQDEKESDDER